MPIKPENKKLYPKNWKEISLHIIVDRAGDKCEECGIKNRLIIKRLADGSYRTPSLGEWDMILSKVHDNGNTMVESIKEHGFIRIILTTAHLDHIPENCSEENLKAMCQKCHNNYDKEHRKETRANGTRKFHTKRD